MSERIGNALHMVVTLEGYCQAALQKVKKKKSLLQIQSGWETLRAPTAPSCPLQRAVISGLIRPVHWSHPSTPWGTLSTQPRSCSSLKLPTVSDCKCGPSAAEGGLLGAGTLMTPQCHPGLLLREPCHFTRSRAQ